MRVSPAKFHTVTLQCSQLPCQQESEYNLLWFVYIHNDIIRYEQLLRFLDRVEVVEKTLKVVCIFFHATYCPTVYFIVLLKEEMLEPCCVVLPIAEGSQKHSISFHRYVKCEFYVFFCLQTALTLRWNKITAVLYEVCVEEVLQ